VTVTTGPSAALQLTSQPTAPGLPAHPSLPAKPSVGDFAQRATAAGFSAPSNGASNPAPAAALQALSGSNSDIVANRAAIRLANMANMNAAELLKAELAGLRPVKATSTATFSAPVTSGPDLSPPDISATGPVSALDESMNEDEVPGFGAASKDTETPSKPVVLAAEEGDHPTPIAGTELVHNVEVVGE
jgi:5'-3' exoribonuclease 2